MESSKFRSINNDIPSAIPRQSDLDLRREASVALIEMLSSRLYSEEQNDFEIEEWLSANMPGIRKDPVLNKEFLWAMSIDLEALLEVSRHKYFTNIPHLAAILVKLTPYFCLEFEQT